MLCFYATLFLTLLIACSSSEDTSIPEIPVMTLIVVDSLGVEYGDTTQMYGSIAGAGFLSYEEFVVLDNVMKTVRKYSRSGEYLGLVEYQGSGPLEIVNAGHLCPLEEGFAVMEQYLPPKYLMFDSSMMPQKYVVIQENAPLFESWILEDSTIVSGIYSIRNNGDQMQIGMDVCKWNMSGERAIEYYSEYYPISGAEAASYEVFIALEFCIAASRSGRVFVVPDRSGFQIYSFAADGICVDTLYTHHELNPRSQEEIIQETEFRKMRDRHLGDWMPSQLETGIVQLQVQDSLGYLWAIHGSYFDPEFDVYVFDGELAFSCECEGLPGNEMFRFSITDFGYLAYSMHPYDYPKVYILELSE